MFDQVSLENISTLILAAGALGAAAFGIVEALKWLPFVGEFGFVVMLFRLGTLTKALEYAYGRPDPVGDNSATTWGKQRKIRRWWNTWGESDKVISEELWDLLRAQYRGDQDELKQVLRQGIRLGLTPATAKLIAADLKMIDDVLLQEVARKIHEGREGDALTMEERNVLGKFELAADARIDAALTLAQSHYKGKLQLTAGCIAVLIALTAASVSDLSADVSQFTSMQAQGWTTIGHALLVGILAVPVAPISHNIVDALKAAASAIGLKP